jgi:hypothetical protein
MNQQDEKKSRKEARKILEKSRVVILDIGGGRQAKQLKAEVDSLIRSTEWDEWDLVPNGRGGATLVRIAEEE